ncbi:hypothetical protein NQZ68_000603 [Dissostichus eleginoides]|nr:hypothetical protein NQZ68_000603 [Dissostichus eleginoides]
MAKIISLSFPRGPDTENNFPLASADTRVNEDIQPPGPAACSSYLDDSVERIKEVAIRCLVVCLREKEDLFKENLRW